MAVNPGEGSVDGGSVEVRASVTNEHAITGSDKRNKNNK
jgi:hypothetical protein